MSSEAWSGISLASVAATGDLTQLYPTWCSAGVAKSSSTVGQLIRRPMQGALHSIQLKGDGSHSGYLEIWDLNGEDAGVDVSSATAITNTQKASITLPTVPKLIFRQDMTGLAGAGIVNAAGIYRTFARGLAARWVGDGGAGAGGGACELNLVVTGGFCKVESRGSY